METVNFSLKTRDINPSENLADYASNTVLAPNVIVNRTNKGIVTNTRFTFTWYNVDLKAILADMWDKYEYFKIKLNFVAGSSNGSVATQQDYHTVEVKMSGLGFISTYNNLNKCNSGSATFTLIQGSNSSYGTWNFNNFSEQSYTFSKQDIAQITIDLYSVYTESMFIYNTGFGQSQLFGQMIFGFTITGDNHYKTITDNYNKNNILHRIF